jgi:hypothetical protein
MPRTSDLTPAQMKIARQIRGLRLQIGMGVPRFGKLIGMDSSGINHRELLRVPWRESELQAALPPIVNHLRLTLQLSEALAGVFAAQEQAKPQPTKR